MSRLWWDGVPNASRFIRHIGEQLERGKNVLLLMPEYVPWHDTFHDILEEYQRQNISSYGINMVIDDELMEPGEIIFNRYCKRELRDDYRPAIGYSKFLASAESIPLNNTIVWVRLKNFERTQKWAAFVSDYSESLGNRGVGGLFIIESDDGGAAQFKKYKRVSCVEYAEFLTSFDVYIYSVLASSSLKLSRNTKEYLSDIMISVIGNDVELVCHCLKEANYSHFISDPRKVIDLVCVSEIRSDGERFVYDVAESEYTKRMWNAQIKSLFPRIETFREEFIDKYYENIKKNLPINNSNGEAYENPEDVELGTLHHLAYLKCLPIDKKDYQQLDFYKNCRNKLAHLNMLSFDEVEALLSN